MSDSDHFEPDDVYAPETEILELLTDVGPDTALTRHEIYEETTGPFPEADYHDALLTLVDKNLVVVNADWEYRLRDTYNKHI